MIRPSYMCSSPYDSDLYQDFSPFAEASSAFLEDYMNNYDWQSTDWENLIPPPFADVISTSSDSEHVSLADPEDALEISDSFVSHILEDNFLGCSEVSGFSEADSYFTESPKRCNSPDINKAETLTNSSKRTKKSLNFFSTKLWSKMTSVEQLQTLHKLSEIVTRRMNRTEQMEIIKIINPSVNISAHDTEFALDSSYLSDVKLKRIKQFIRKSNSCSSENIQAGSFCQTSFKKSKILSRKASSSTPSGTKRRQKKEKVSPCDEKMRLQQKLELHGQKEAQSGLFVYEKVIKKLSNPLEEDEDVNILE